MFSLNANQRKSLAIIILIALVLSAYGFLKAPDVKAQVSDAKVLSFTSYVAPSNTIIASYVGDLIVVGEIQNVGSNTLGYVYVGGNAYNSTGEVLASEETRVLGSFFAPGQKAPFYIDFQPEASVTGDQSWIPDVANITVYVTYVNVTQPRYTGVGIPQGGSTAYLNSGTYTVSGLVQNNGNQTTGAVGVITTFYNATGAVIGLNYTDFISNSLSPGQSATFTATPTDNSAQLSSQIANYSVIVQTLAYTAPTPTPSTSSNPTSSPSPPATTPSSSASPQPTLTPSPPTGPSTIVYVVAGVAVVVIVIAALFFLRKRK